MLTWFIYDISDDKVRNNIVKIAREYGLYRVQKSVFLGNVNKKKMDEIYNKLIQKFDKNKKNINSINNNI